MAISITILWIYFKPTLESIPKMSYIESEVCVMLFQQKKNQIFLFYNVPLLYLRLNFFFIILEIFFFFQKPFTWKHYYILFVMATTTILWVTFVLTEEFFCHLGVIGLIPVLCYFSIGILDKVFKKKNSQKGKNWRAGRKNIVLKKN